MPRKKWGLKQWLDESADHRAIRDTVTGDWELMEGYDPSVSLDASADFERLQKRIQQDAKPTLKVVPLKARRQWLSWAAAALVLLTAAWWLWPSPATAPHMLLAETGQGEQKSLELADGSRVWLNQNSRLAYPEQFTGDLREVVLTGEGYFQVQKNPAQAFTIQANQSTVTVLGTAFNLRSYPNESFVEVVVDEGKVRFSSKDEKDNILLELDQKGVYLIDRQSFEESPKEDANASAWKNDVLVFNEIPLQQAVEDISRFFDIQLTIDQADMHPCPITGRFPNPKLEDILDLLVSLFDMELRKVDEQTYELLNGKCG